MQIKLKTKLKEVAVSKIKPNPFRKMDRYPIDRDRVKELKNSMNTTGWWSNIVGRESNGGIEIAYGHHRLVALKEAYGTKTKVDLLVTKLDDAMMLKIMAHENQEDWKTMASVEQETVRAVVEAYGKEIIDLPQPSPKAGSVRHAPSFKIGVLGPTRGLPYTRETVAKFIGWDKDKVGRILTALELTENSCLDTEDFNKLTKKQASEVAKAANAEKRKYEKEVEFQEKEIKRAPSKRAEQKAKKRLKRAKRDVKAEPRRVGKEIARQLRTEEITTKTAASEARNQSKSRQKTTSIASMPSIETFAERKIKQIEKWTESLKREWKEELNELVKYRADINPTVRRKLVRALRVVGESAVGWSEKIEAE